MLFSMLFLRYQQYVFGTSFLKMALARATALLASLLSCATAQTIVVESDGAYIDSAVAINAYTYANSTISGQKSSFSVSDDGTFARISWGISDYATQGSFIAEKACALAPPGASYNAHQIMVRNWLLKLPLTPDGRAFGTEGGELHMGGQGAYEGTAEVLLMARAYLAHTGDVLSFEWVPERLVCWTDANGVVRLAGVGHPGLDDSACSASPSSFLAHGVNQFMPEGPIAPSAVTFGNSTVKTTIYAHAKALVQYITLEAAWSAVSVAVTVAGTGVGSMQAMIVDSSTGKVVYSQPVPPQITTTWLTMALPPGTTAPAGGYSIQLVPAAENSTPGSAFALQWITDARPTQPGKSSYYTYLAADYSTAVPSLPPVYTLGQQLSRALNWQLALMATGPSSYDILVIREAAYRGSAEAAVNSGSSYYDLLRMGFAASYINLRVLESMVAYSEMVNASAVPPVPGLQSIMEQVATAIGDRFGDSAKGTFVAWYGCTCTQGGNSTCLLSGIHPGSTDPCLQSFDIGFIPGQALAVKLGVVAGPSSGGSYTATVAALAQMRDLARYGGGQFRTNVISIESVTPLAWLAADRWNDKDANGYAVREWNQTGDWMMFNTSSGADGNGNYGLQEENGGRLLSTSAFVFETGNGGGSQPTVGVMSSSPYAEITQDWADFVEVVTNITLQLEAGDYNEPLLPYSNPPMTRTRMVNGSLPQHLCAVPRGEGSLTKKDLFGYAWCDYYKTVSFDLPEAGLALYSFVKGLLGLYVRADGTLLIAGQPLPTPTGSLTVPVPPGWPATTQTVSVIGLNVGKSQAITLFCAAQGSELMCTTSG